VTTINLNGGTLTHTPATNLSVWGTAVNMTAGTLQATTAGGQIDFGTDANAGNVLTAVNTLPSADPSTIGGTRLNLRQASTTFNVAEGAAPADLVVSAPVTEGVVGAGVIKAGAGTMAMTGTNTYTGPTTVSAGTLLVSGSISGSAVAVKSGAVLAGDGATGAVNVESGGLVSPGNTVGTLRTGAFTMSAGSTLSLQINAPTPSLGYDQVSLRGAADITGATLSLSGTYLSQAGASDLFFILLNDDVDGTIGTFGGLAEGSQIQSASGQRFRITYAADSITNSFTGGNDVALMAVPEPASAFMILAAGGLLLAGRPRRGKPRVLADLE